MTIDKKIKYENVPQLVKPRKDGKRPGYRGPGGYQGGSSSSGGKSSSSAGKGGGADIGRGPDDRSTAQQTANTKAAISSAKASKDDVREQYRLDTPVTVGQVLSPDFTKVGPGSTMDNNRILASNLANRPFQGVNVPPYIPGSSVINVLGNLFGGFGYEKNRDFFLENVAGKKSYGYSYEDFAQYMKDRGLDKVDAYGNPVTRERGGDNPLQNLLISQAIADPLGGAEEDLSDVEKYYRLYRKNLGYID